MLWYLCVSSADFTVDDRQECHPVKRTNVLASHNRGPSIESNQILAKQMKTQKFIITIHSAFKITIQQALSSRVCIIMVNQTANNKRPMSKTKALAMRRKPAAVKAHLAASTCGSAKGSKPDQLLMAKLLEQYILHQDPNAEEETLEGQKDTTSPVPGLSFCDILKSMGMNDRNTGWRNAWKDLIQTNLIEPSTGSGGGGTFTSPFCLTKKGIDKSSTPELKAALEQAKQQRPKTNEEHHERIKSKLMNNRGVQIFDLLLNEGPLSRLDLAAKLGVNHTGAYFSYALQELRELGYAENVKGDGKKMKIQLTNKAFITPPCKNAAKQGCKDEAGCE